MLKQLRIASRSIPVLLTFFVACESDDPESRPSNPSGGQGGTSSMPSGGLSSGANPEGGSGGSPIDEPEGGSGGSPTDEPEGGSGGSNPGESSLDVDANLTRHEPNDCSALDSDYAPGDDADEWDACISDDNEYHTVNPSIGALNRVAAFEEISQVLGFGGRKVPTPEDFLEARVLYTQMEGIESRVVRREDEHYPALERACRDLTADEQAENPDRCVGPVKIRPVLNAAFEAGFNGENPVENASKIEAALLWFFYISSFKEATTCVNAAQDCDSAWAKYTGGSSREEDGLGLSRYVKARSLVAHDRTWDALLAVRCWRDLDNPGGQLAEPAANLELRDKARAQLDRALLFGVAQILRQRVQTLPSPASWEGTKILAYVLDRDATERDADAAETLRTEFEKSDAANVDPEVVIEALDELYPCP